MCSRRTSYWLAYTALAATPVLTRAARAAEYTWNSGSSGTFTDPTRWTPAGGPPLENDTAVFSDPGGAPYTVAVPRIRAVGDVQVVGDRMTFELDLGLVLTSSSPAALHLRPSGNRPAILHVVGNGSVNVRSGGITLSGTANDAGRHNSLRADTGYIQADSLTLRAGEVVRVGIIHDAEIGNPGAAPGNPIAFLSDGEVVGALHIYPDAVASGRISGRYGGVVNEGILGDGRPGPGVSRRVRGGPRVHRRRGLQRGDAGQVRDPDLR